MIRGLALHYLHQGTVEDAIEQGKAGGLPTELLETFPGMMFEITSAASAVFAAERTIDDAVDELAERLLRGGRTIDFRRDDALALVNSTIEFFAELSEGDRAESPLPPIAVPWYLFGTRR